jgi:hypothetical protein
LCWFKNLCQTALIYFPLRGVELFHSFSISTTLADYFSPEQFNQQVTLRHALSLNSWGRSSKLLTRKQTNCSPASFNNLLALLYCRPRPNHSKIINGLPPSPPPPARSLNFWGEEFWENGGRAAACDGRN